MFKDEEILTLNFVGSIQCDQMLKNNSPIFPKVAKKVVLIKEWCFMK